MRVVVTGIGLATPLGNQFWECVSKGIIKTFCVSGYEKGALKIEYLLLEAVKKAVSDANITDDLLKKSANTVSSSKGTVIYRRINLDGFMPNIISRHFGCTGPSLNIISACATGLSSIIIGANIIKSKRASTVIAGGVDSCLTDFVISAFDKLGVLAKDSVCRPYSKNRSGFVLSEGACVVILEEFSQAKSRGAAIYGEITGFSSLGDAYHITSMNPNGDTIKKAVEICLNRSRTSLHEIDYINTHGTGTIENDLIETKALKDMFTFNRCNIPLSSTKPVTGHMLGASGAGEFIIGLLAMKEQFIPPTINLNEPDPLCDLDYIPNIGRKKNINKFLKLSYGFGGHVSCVEVTKL